MEPANSIDDLASEAARTFEDRFGRPPVWMVTAPGRVNLIGEHVDYNSGLVLPMAIERWTIMAADGNGTHTANLYTTLTEEAAEIRLDEFPAIGLPHWSNYIRGVLAGFRLREVEPPGFDAVVHSNVPGGGGLSSSAALEVSAATLLETVCGHELDPVDKAYLCQKAEHDFGGVPCGIMDQLVTVTSEEDHLLLIDCGSGETTPVEFCSEDVAILIADTHVSHELSESEYAKRRLQCDGACESLLVSSLREVHPEKLEDVKARMDETVWRRARHVVSEIDRTRKAVEAVKAEDWPAFGALMFESHDSLRDDYEVSCLELDVMVDIARSLGRGGGVYGSRMTGAGFGGCTVSLVETARLEEISRALHDGYEKATGIEPEVFSTRPAAGTRVLKAPEKAGS